MIGTDLIRVGDAAKIIGCSPERVRQLADMNRLPCERSPFGRVFDRAVVEAYARERAARQGGRTA